MTPAMPVVWSDRHRLHEPGGEVWVGVRTPGTEVAERAERILAALAGARFVAAEPQPDEALLAVHDADLLDYLEHAWADWDAAGMTAHQDRVVPYIFPRSESAPIPAAVTARAGRFAYDTMTLIGPGTWEAARAAVDVAVTAARLVRAGEPAAYALCRPPGHHVTRTAFGGSCYLNNTAAAAAALGVPDRPALPAADAATRRRSGGPPCDLAPVAVLDIDAHHGNGTQAIFHDDPSVLTGSVHVDPGAGWFPHFLGFAGEGGDSNRNVPLPPGAGDDEWLGAIAGLLEWVRDARALVVALGVDAAAGDPESPLNVTADGFRAAGRLFGAAGLPTVLVQEGGYDLEAIGELVLETLTGVEEGRHG